MLNIVNTPVLLQGIGKGYFETVSGKVLELKTSQSMKMEITTSQEHVYGGDSLFPIYTYLTQKEGKIEINNADFSISQLNIMQDTVNKTTGVKGTYRYIVAKTSTTTMTQLTTTTITGVSPLMIMGPDGMKVTASASSTPGSGEIYIDSTGAVEFDADCPDGEYSIWVEQDEANAIEAQMLKDAMPEVASFNWTFNTIDSPGNRYKIDLYAPRVRGDGAFTIETNRESATVPVVTVDILDPGDGRYDFATIKIAKI